jgi:hypothetical protein
MEEKLFTSSLNIYTGACYMIWGGGRSDDDASALTITIFPSYAVDICFKDDVNVTLLLVFPSWLLTFMDRPPIFL